MRRILGSLLLLFVCSAAFTQGDGKPVLAVLNFDAVNIPSSEARILADFLTTHAVETGRYRVIDRAQREAILSEVEFSAATRMDEQAQLQVGKLLSADQLVVGSVAEVDGRILLSVKLILAETGEVLSSISRGYESLPQVLSSSREIAIALLTRKRVDQQKEGKSSTRNLPTDPVNSVGMLFRLVEAGTFRMGSSTGEVHEAPVHDVSITLPYYIAKHEVTQAQWSLVMGANPSYFKGEQRPVEQVDWFGATDFCNRLSLREGLQPCYRSTTEGISCDVLASGYRLPSEAEWEFAARGGSQGSSFELSGGNREDEVAWYEENSGNSTHPVGAKSPNELGLHDMSGNVWEWCHDAAHPYSSQSVDDPRGPLIQARGSSRASRGGGYSGARTKLRVAYRGFSAAEMIYRGQGFRVARSVTGADLGAATGQSRPAAGSARRSRPSKDFRGPDSQKISRSRA